MATVICSEKEKTTDGNGLTVGNGLTNPDKVDV